MKMKISSSHTHQEPRAQQSYQLSNSNYVQVRAYRTKDLQNCRDIFTQGMVQLISLVLRVVFPRYIWLSSASSLFVLVLVVLFQWTSTAFYLYILTCAIALSMLYIHVYIECWKFINSCLATDLRDIEKTYMTNDGCHMWVAEWSGKVVGMVGLVHNESHKPGVAELQRMSVSPACRRMGIARKLLDELLNYAKDKRLERLVLTTTNAQTPAIRLYKKYGFKLVAVFLHPYKTLSDLQYQCFELHLRENDFTNRKSMQSR
ncbi:probable N-acetyltransferase CML1 [Stylophora pistillata]|uniref:N-acetylaspartate synthetase n=1 Tax=Stylophora pistillata TaxID=50429 RepID=A0A2B4S2C4_STYPI|nr:probable N-acetyltransferase CML1 [Stylophora pistillata]XP_022795261.1 probable N-acetyltransferase CML1 [Stylophora pistillata]XP_022795262.1 probable N-acetyltransferase CML1 [Stylophora pistillata]PFX22708.1 N-acetylaspartate synthetase [Stylophora pistillata]